jgi:hypothetical protein
VSQGIRNDSITKQCLCCVSTVQCAVCCASAVVLSLFTLSWRACSYRTRRRRARGIAARTDGSAQPLVRQRTRLVEPAFAALRVTK